MSCSSIRLDRLRAACRDFDSDMQAFCVRDTSNIFWLTTFDDVFDEESAHALLVDLVDGSRVVLHTDSRYVTACEHAACNTGIAVSTERVSHGKFAVDFLCEGVADSSTGAHLGIEDSITLAEYHGFERACCVADERSVHLTETSDLILGLRGVKDATEIVRLREAQAITDAAFSHIVGFMRPGMTERAVQLELDDYMRQAGADSLSFPSIVATGAHAASPHAISGDTPLEEGQCVVLDFGARKDGYCSDITRTVFLGDIDATFKAAYDALQRANGEVKAFLRPGVTGAQAHELAERILDEAGFGGTMGHGLGHGVGIDIHELPVLSPRNTSELICGNVVTVEPGIYIPGEFGMRLEDCGIVTEDGFESFTASMHDPVQIF